MLPYLLAINSWYRFLQLIKYCPFCRYQTDDNKITRHIKIKHLAKIRKPIDKSLREIGKIFGPESRRSVTLVPMDVTRDQLGPYWDDVPYRKIAFRELQLSLGMRIPLKQSSFCVFRLCVMGRMKVYGGQWNLPDAPLIEDTFAVYYRTSDARTQTPETKLEAPTRVEPPYLFVFFICCRKSSVRSISHTAIRKLPKRFI